MKTKEEILERLAKLNDCYMDDRYRTTCIDAMGEFADEVVKNLHQYPVKSRLEKVWNIEIKKEVGEVISDADRDFYAENWRKVADECQQIADQLYTTNK